jgi:hypothetical protein
MAKKKAGPSRDPFAEDDDDMGAADDRALDSFKEKAGIEGAADESAGDDLELEIGEPDEPDEPVRPSRDERRRNRYREEQEARIRAETEAAELRGRMAAIESMQRQQQATQAAPEKDELKAKLEDVYKRQDELNDAYRAKATTKTLTPEDERSMRQRARELDEERLAIIAQRTARAQQPISAADVARAARAQQIAARHSDVLSNQQYAKYAEGLYQQKIAEGYADTEDTADMVADMTRQRFGLQSRTQQHRRTHEPPSQAQRSRYSGAPTGGGAGPAPKRTSVTITPEIRKLARGAFPHMDERKALQTWVNSPAGKAHANRQG